MFGHCSCQLEGLGSDSGLSLLWAGGSVWGRMLSLVLLGGGFYGGRSCLLLTLVAWLLCKPFMSPLHLKGLTLPYTEPRVISKPFSDLNVRPGQRAASVLGRFLVPEGTGQGNESPVSFSDHPWPASGRPGRVGSSG